MSLLPGFAVIQIVYFEYRLNEKKTSPIRGLFHIRQLISELQWYFLTEHEHRSGCEYPNSYREVQIGSSK